MALVKPKNTSQQSGAKSTGRMVSEFSNKTTILWFLVALAIHVAFIGATSIGYIKRQIAGEPPATTQPAEPTTAPTAEATPAAKTPAPAEATANANPTPATPTDDKKTAEERKDTAVMKNINDAASPEEVKSAKPSGSSILDEKLE